VHKAYSHQYMATATAGVPGAAMKSADVNDRVASLDGPEMPAHLAAKVADAIAAESARRFAPVH